MNRLATSFQSATPPAHWRTALGAVVVLALLLIAPTAMYPVFVMKLMCYALFAATFNLLFGYAGLLSFGHAAFLGSGAYVAAHAAKVWGLDPVLCLTAAMATAGVLGWGIGFLAIRRSGIEFSMITLALAEMISFLAHRAPFTGGENGFQGVPRGVALGVLDLSEPANIYAFTMIVFGIGMFAIWRTINSPFGHILRAVRDHENRSISLGYDVQWYKLTAFVISAVLAGLAGGLKAIVFQFAVLDDISFHTSGHVVLMTLLGGLGLFFGPLVGATVVVVLESYLATSSFPAPVIIGAVFILCVLLFRRGIVGELAARLRL